MKRVFIIVTLLLAAISPALAQDASSCSAGSADYYLDKGRQAANVENYDLALNYFRCAILLNPEDATLYEERGAVYFTLQNYEKAASDYEQVVRAQPENAAAMFRLGYSLQEIGSYQRALEIYNSYLELEPEDSTGYNNRGVAYYSLERYDEALADYTRALELDNANVFALTNRASIYMDREAYDLALTDINRALQVQDKADYYLTRAVIYELDNQPEQAAADFWRWVVRIELDSVEEKDFQPGTLRSLPMTEGRVYYLPFEAELGQVISVTAVGEAEAQESIDPLLVILDPARKPVAANDDGAGGLNSLIDGYAFPETGTYYLVVSHAGGGASGVIALTSRIEAALTVGQDVMIRTKKDDYLNLRAAAGLDAEVLERLPDGTYATTLEGPVSADGYVWWRVRAAGDAVEGWVVLSADGESTLVPRRP